MLCGSGYLLCDYRVALSNARNLKFYASNERLLVAHGLAIPIDYRLIYCVKLFPRLGGGDDLLYAGCFWLLINYSVYGVCNVSVWMFKF